jgi:hypothetical protein
VNQLVLSGTATLVPSGTQSSCYRGPKSGLRPCCATLCSARNFPNLKSFGFFLTDRAFVAAGDNQQRLSASAALVSLSSPIQNQRIDKTRLRQQLRSTEGRARWHCCRSSLLIGCEVSALAIGVCDPTSMADAHRRHRPATGVIFSNMEEVHERSHAGRDSVA